MIEKVKKQTIRGYDPLLGYTYNSSQDIKLLENEEYKETLIFAGDQKEYDVKIAILGGSTSDINYDGSWIRPFYKIVKNKKNPLIISGAISGYTSSQELLKLIRDILPQKPDIVINLSGINDIGCMQSFSKKYPLIHRYQYNIGKFLIDNFGDSKEIKQNIFEKKQTKNNTTLLSMYKEHQLGQMHLGVQNKLPCYKVWLNNMLNIHSICVANNIKHISFLQPVFGFGDYTYTKEEYAIFLKSLQNIKNIDYPLEINSFYSNIIQKIKDENIEYIKNLSNIFKDSSKVYEDIRHPNKKGNAIIAKEIFGYIEHYL